MSVKVAGIAVAALVAILFLLRPPLVGRIDDAASDVISISHSAAKTPVRVAIVEIDEASLSRFGRWPWRRDLLARVVRGVLDHGAATVVLDMALASVPDDEGGDEILAATIRAQPVVTGYAFRFDGSGPVASKCDLHPLPLVVFGPSDSRGPGFFHPSGAICSAHEISEVAAGEGFLNAAVDSDGKLRRIPVVMQFDGREYASLALAAVNVYRQTSSMRLNLHAHEAASLSLGNTEVPLEGPSEMRLRFRGGRAGFPYTSVSDLLDGKRPRNIFQDKIVIVGGSAPGLPNPIATPVDPQFPEAEVQATAIDNILQGDSLHRPASFRLWEAVLAILGGIAATFALVVGRSWQAAVVLLISVALAWIASAVLLAKTGLLLSPLPLTAVLACNVPTVALLNFLREKRRAELTERQLWSERSSAKALLGESESRYQRLVENINDAIIMDDSEMRLVFVNGRFREWFGLQDKDVHEIRPEDWVAPEWLASLRERHRRRMRGESVPEKFEYQCIGAGGARLWIEALVTSVLVGGKVMGTQAALRDITERKRVEAQYLQSQKMESVGRLAGGVAHDFNNLLQVINGYTDMLLNQLPEESQYHADLKAIRSAGERASELTRNLLTFSRKQIARPAVLELNQVIAEAGKMFGQLIGEDIELSMSLSSTLGAVMADAGQIHQILMNLLINARDALPSGGKITIETRNIDVDADFIGAHPKFELGKWVYLGVADNGCGMSDDVMAHLFEPFFTTKPPGRGTGLGLATIYGIVEQSAGKIEVTSRLGSGTTFHIYFPRVASGVPQPQVAESTNVPLRGSGTILVVEDQEPVRKYLHDVLKRSGFQVLLAGNGVEALELAERFEGAIDLVITDLVMPVMNGRELAEKMKRIRPKTMVLFISGYEKESIDSRGIGDDLVFLQKPFSAEQLRMAVREAIGNSSEPAAGASSGA